jgi:hypothetical protein
MVLLNRASTRRALDYEWSAVVISPTVRAIHYLI